MDDRLVRRAYFLVGDMVRAGYEFEKKTLLMVQIDDDARKGADPLHPMARIEKAMRNLYAVPVFMELRGEPIQVYHLSGLFEKMVISEGFKVLPMPKGFVAGWT